MTQLGKFDLTCVTAPDVSQNWDDARAAAFTEDRVAALVVEGSAWGPLLLVHPADVVALAKSITRKNRAMSARQAIAKGTR
jgi:hypothetical protein